MLLGDVYYSDDVMDQLFGIEEPVKVVGSRGEIFGVVWTDNDLVSNTLDIASKEKNARLAGRLWTFYHKLDGIDGFGH